MRSVADASHGARARELAALALVMARFWLVVFPLVRVQVRGWQRLAATIPDPSLRAQALATLESERLSAAGAALFAATTPRRRDPGLVRALVAYQVICDYLDTLAEQPSERPDRQRRATAPRARGRRRRSPARRPLRPSRGARRRRLPSGADRRLPRELRAAPGLHAGARGGDARGESQRGAGDQPRAERRARAGAARRGPAGSARTTRPWPATRAGSSWRPPAARRWRCSR